MNDDGTRAITRVESHTVHAAEAAVSHGHQPPKNPAAEEHRAARAREQQRPAVPEEGATDLSYQADPESEHILVQIVDRDTGSVVRSFPIDLPGDDVASDQEPARGGLVDAKA
jgi:uncharacterized FlaG/YvyC family protein